METFTLTKSDRDGGGTGTFRSMTLAEAKALPYGEHIWLRMRSGANGPLSMAQTSHQQLGISRFKSWRVATDIGGLNERDILDGLVLVEVASNGDKISLTLVTEDRRAGHHQP